MQSSMKTQPKKRICQVTFTILCACFILSSGFSSVYILCQFHPEWWSVPEGGVFAGFVLAIIGIAGCFLGVVILSCLLLLMERVRSFCRHGDEGTIPSSTAQQQKAEKTEEASTMRWKTLENKLIVDGKEVAVFPYPVLMAKEIQDTIVLILDIPKDVVFSRNAYGYVLPEKRLWQIEKYYPEEPIPGIRVIDFCLLEKPGKVLLWTWVCVTLVVKLRSGRVLKKIIGK